jgi:predicted metal-dependent phosphoesterase TrpH
MTFDLHSHSTASDGELSPSALIARARDNGVSCLAITDHDTVEAYCNMPDDDVDGVTICRGIELSCNWQGRSVHVVGLNIRLESAALQAALRVQQQNRNRRAELIAERLSKKGIDGAMAGARALAGNAIIGRPHFARFLVSAGTVRDERQAFKRYLGNGKLGDVQHNWPGIATVIQWIREAGGLAVLAHPAHYKLTNTKLALLTGEFVAAGGAGIEVVSGRQSADLTNKLAELAVAKQLLASTGSDFHRTGQSWSDVGRQSALPDHLTPVWDAW